MTFYKKNETCDLYWAELAGVQKLSFAKHSRAAIQNNFFHSYITFVWTNINYIIIDVLYVESNCFLYPIHEFVNIMWDIHL